MNNVARICPRMRADPARSGPRTTDDRHDRRTRRRRSGRRPSRRRRDRDQRRHRVRPRDHLGRKRPLPAGRAAGRRLHRRRRAQPSFARFERSRHRRQRRRRRATSTSFCALAALAETITVTARARRSFPSPRRPSARWSTSRASSACRSTAASSRTSRRRFPASASASTPTRRRARSTRPQISGGNGRNVNYVVDGGDNNDDTVGGLLQLFPLEAIQEFNVLTQRFDAEYGRSGGAC